MQFCRYVNEKISLKSNAVNLMCVINFEVTKACQIIIILIIVAVMNKTFSYFLNIKYTYQPRRRHLWIDKVNEECGNFCFSFNFLSRIATGGWKVLFTLIFMFFFSSPFSSFYFSPLLVRMKNLVDIKSSKAKVLLSLFPSKKKERSFLIIHLEIESFLFEPCDIDFSRMFFREERARCSQEELKSSGH